MNNGDHKQTWLSAVHKELGKKVVRSLGDYIEAPNEERTHDLRVAIRRFLVLTKQTPRKQRDKELRRYRTRCKKFLRLTAKVRDLDVIRGRLGRHPDNGAVPLLLQDLAGKRRELAKVSVKTARKLRDDGQPDKTVRIADGPWPRIRRSLAEFDVNVPRRLSFVLKSDANVKALHQLKKEVRRYRYLLELLPQGQGMAKACDTLRQLQDRLGEIRDSDVVLEFLEGAGESRDVRELLDAERNFRDARYRDLVSAYSRGMGDADRSVLEVAGLSRLRASPGVQ